jgi:hypothetical protein
MLVELVAVTLLVVSIGLYLRLRELERRMHIFDKWADWLEEQLFNQSEVTLTLEGEEDGERKD